MLRRHALYPAELRDRWGGYNSVAYLRESLTRCRQYKTRERGPRRSALDCNTHYRWLYVVAAILGIREVVVDAIC
jgi:hypothetical protein